MWLGRRGAAAAATVLVVVAGCTGTEPVAPEPPEPNVVTEAPRPQRTGGTLRIGLATDPRSLDPRFVSDEEGELVVGALFEPLVRIGPDGQPLPAAARSWEVSEDGTTFTFRLREANFHDGSPVTAHDFVRTFTRIADGTAQPPSFLAYLLAPVVGADDALREGAPLAGVSAVDDATFEVRLSEPQPRFLLTLADPSLVPTPEAADTDPEGFAAHPIGNGPFALAGEPEPGGFVRLSAVRDHHRRPQLDEVVLQVYPDDPARDRQWNDLVEGLLHIADVGPGHLQEARSRFGVSRDGVSGPGLVHGPTATVYLVAFDLTRAPYDDPVVRRAISQSIDREALATEILGGLRLPADRIVPPAIPGSQGGVCDHCRSDPEGAAALIAEAEIELPDTLTFTITRGATQAAIAAAIAEDVSAALGVEVVVEPMDLDEFVPAVRRGDAPWFRLGWEVNAPDQGAYLEPLFHSRNVGTDNLSRYEDEETDELLDAARAAGHDAAAYEAYREAERRVLDAVAVAPLLVNGRAKVVDERVAGLRWDPTGRVDLARVRLLPAD